MTYRIEDVISRGICIGCGACALASGGQIHLSLGPLRLYQADLSTASESALRSGSRVCPFSDEAPNEDDLGAPHADDLMAVHPRLGTYTRAFAGRVTRDDYLQDSSSGGLASWLANELVRRGMVDGVINVGKPEADGLQLFEYGETSDPSNPSRRKSQYYASTMAEVLAHVALSDGKYALIGVPCFIKAARALCLEQPSLSSRLVLFVGLVCGHYKTQAFADSMAWQLGIHPNDLTEVDFRVKRKGRPANHYDFGAKKAGEEEWRFGPTLQLIGGNWGHCAFQPQACNYCDDVVGETADVSIGDAWLPRFTVDSRGTNVIICRNRMIDTILDEAWASGEITLETLSADKAAQTQAGGFRHRREGLSVRLADDLAAGLPVPNKRVGPDARAVSPRRARLVRQRRKMAEISHVAFTRALVADDLDIYLNAMHREIRRYKRCEASPWRRLASRVKVIATQVLARFRL